MFVHNFDPILVQIGPLAIHWYSIPYLIGFLLAFWWLKRAWKKGEFDLSKDDLETIMIYLMVGVIVGSRLGILLWQPGYYLRNPLNILKIWEGGMAFHGGLIGITFAAWLYTRKHKKISFHRLADIMTFPAAIALVLGRIGNFINGELWGYVSDLPWCVVFPAVEGCRHPAQLYDGLTRLIVLGFLWAVSKKNLAKGFLFWSFVLLVDMGRFITDFWREEILYAGLSLGQWYSLGFIAISSAVLIKYYKEDIKKLIQRNP